MGVCNSLEQYCKRSHSPAGVFERKPGRWCRDSKSLVTLCIHPQWVLIFRKGLQIGTAWHQNRSREYLRRSPLRAPIVLQCNLRICICSLLFVVGEVLGSIRREPPLAGGTEVIQEQDILRFLAYEF